MDDECCGYQTHCRGVCLVIFFFHVLFFSCVDPALVPLDPFFVLGFGYSVLICILPNFDDFFYFYHVHVIRWRRLDGQ